MKLKGLNDYDICNYKEPAMFLIFPYCTFKCDRESGSNVCQNSALAREIEVEIRGIDIIHRYIKNPLTHAIVCGGLEPFDSWNDLWIFICLFRGFSKDPIIIYTGYKEEELTDKLKVLLQLDNIIVKFGRFIPNRPHIYDTVLGVELASNNQYAKLLRQGMNVDECILEYGGENQNEKDSRITSI